MTVKSLHFGDSVIPNTKTSGIMGLNECKSWKRAIERNQNFLYVIGYAENESGGSWILWDDKDTLDGDFFKSSDFVEL
jgi:hypothetical protein